MNVYELRERLSGYDDNFEVRVYSSDDEDTEIVRIVQTKYTHRGNNCVIIEGK